MRSKCGVLQAESNATYAGLGVVVVAFVYAACSARVWRERDGVKANDRGWG